MLLKTGQESGQRHANRIETRREFIALENALRICQELARNKDARRLREHFHGCAKLWNAGGVSHHAGHRPRGRLRGSLRRCRKSAPAHTHSGS